MGQRGGCSSRPTDMVGNVLYQCDWAHRDQLVVWRPPAHILRRAEIESRAVQLRTGGWGHAAPRGIR